MLLAEAGCVFMGFILYISGVQGQTNSICALKGSSVDLLCSAKHPTSSMKWYTAHWNGSTLVQNELSVDGNRITYEPEENHPALTINDLRESDANFYCCRENTDQPQLCWDNKIQLIVSDLQVKVIPATEGQTVTLMCSTSCPLTETPAAYIWYKNGEFLYQDWSPWYQQLVSSEEAVRYSCAIKGYEDLRAPEVSVDSITSTCFTVTYAKGRMCSYKQTSEDEPCSITYPREVHVQKTAENHVTLTCHTSCPLTDSQTAYRWYHDGYINIKTESQQSDSPSSVENISCAVKGLEDLLSAEVCTKDQNCWTVNYISRRICALQGSSVNISSEYSYPYHQLPQSKSWFKITRSGKEEVKELIEAAGHVEYYDNMKNHHILRINNLKKNDSAEYTFRLQRQNGEWKQSDSPGVTLVVTGLEVKFTPSAVVTEGQRVTLTCSTSCPLTDNTNYIWYLNSRPLTLPENQNKHLVLDPVSSQHAGNYSCAVKTHNNISSREKTLTVHSKTGKWTPAAAAGVGAVLLVIIPLTVFCWIRRKRTSSQSPRIETSDNLEQLNPGRVYDEISAQPTEQDDLHYSEVCFHQNHADPLYSTVQPHQPQEEVPYAVVNIRPNTTPE
uniref:Ig-like domain-containing protein n=2 Tax=Dicentrarchus labrax TaxID=13489 RepID=A0A8P4KPW8_DICLA